MLWHSAKGGNFCLRFRKARALVSWLYHFSAHLRKSFDRELSSSGPTFKFDHESSCYLSLSVESFFLYSNICCLYDEMAISGGKVGKFCAHTSSTNLLEWYQFALCGLSSFLKLPISDAVWIRVSESQFRNSELLSLMANVQFL